MLQLFCEEEVSSQWTRDIKRRQGVWTKHRDSSTHHLKLIFAHGKASPSGTFKFASELHWYLAIRIALSKVLQNLRRIHDCIISINNIWINMKDRDKQRERSASCIVPRAQQVSASLGQTNLSPLSTCALVDLCEALVDAPKQQGTKRADSAHHALLLSLCNTSKHPKVSQVFADHRIWPLMTNFNN